MERRAGEDGAAVNAWQTFWTGIDPGHMAGFVAGVLAAIVLPLIPRAPAYPADRWAMTLLGVSGAVHIALPVNHSGPPLLAAGFVVSGLAYGVLAYFAFVGRAWRAGTLVVVPLTLVAYLMVVVSGREEADQIGVATALVEMTAAGLALRGLRGLRVAGSVGTALTVTVFGAVVWIATFVAHQAGEANPAGPSVSSGHSHEHLARTQAGVIMRPEGGAHPTAQQQKAAGTLATATAEAVAKYARIEDALAAGYAWPLGKHTGPDVHMENGAYKKDGRVLDPAHPEMLVYAVGGGKAVLLGVVYVMEEAGQPGPAPGGPITRWHAHNLCVSLMPPGVGIVTPYGGCPALSVTGTIPEMMHVWIVKNPAGTYAEFVDRPWALAYLRDHGRVMTAA
jgi:tetrahydromethanopterin S-methyltransferase subunit F